MHARITGRRRDHLHKLSTRIIRENQTVIIEDLPVRNLARNHTLARAISDSSWAQLRRHLRPGSHPRQHPDGSLGHQADGSARR